MERSHAYDDIIDLPHHVSAERPHMPMIERAAQFSPFAALTGYGAAVEETARLTDEKPELDEEQKQRIGRRLSELQSRLREEPAAAVTYFVPDTRKSGGKTVSLTGTVKKVDELGRTLLMADGTVIPFDDLYALELPDADREG